MRDLKEELSKGNTFGGYIFENSFSCRSMADIAKQIESDWAFDRSCRMQCETRDRNYELKKLQKGMFYNEN